MDGGSGGEKRAEGEGPRAGSGEKEEMAERMGRLELVYYFLVSFF